MISVISLIDPFPETGRTPRRLSFLVHTRVHFLLLGVSQSW